MRLETAKAAAAAPPPARRSRLLASGKFVVTIECIELSPAPRGVDELLRLVIGGKPVDSLTLNGSTRGLRDSNTHPMSRRADRPTSFFERKCLRTKRTKLLGSKLFVYTSRASELVNPG